MGGVLAALGSENSPPVPPPPRPSSLAPLPHLSPGGTEFLKTPLGGSFLVYESFLYRREKAAGDKVYWTCRDQARMGCRSRAITQGQQVTVMRGHCHSPDLAGLEALRQRERLPSPPQQEDPEKIQLLPEAQLCFETCSPENQESYGKVEDTRLDSQAQ